MKKKQVTTRLDAPIAEALQSYCKMNGLIINSFIQDCVLERLEELLDIEDIKKIKKEPTRPFNKILAELKYNG